jgi:hypothetical protein
LAYHFNPSTKDRPEEHVAKHTIDFDIPARKMGNVDITCHPKSNGRKLGTLELSKGSVDWTPRRNSVNVRTFTWEKFAALLERGQVPPIKKGRPRKKRAV